MEKVSFSKRLIAYVLDIMFVMLLINLICSIKFINPNYDKYKEASESYINLTKEYNDNDVDEDTYISESKIIYYNMNKYGISYNVVKVLVIILYFGVFEYYNKGQSLGKKITKIKVVDNDKKTNVLNYILRSIPLFYLSLGNVILSLLSIVLLPITKTNYMMSILVINYIVIMINSISIVMIYKRSDNRGIHELISGTKVVNE